MYHKAALLLAIAGTVSATSIHHAVAHARRATPALPPNWAAAGCYTDSSSRTLMIQAFANDNSLSVEKCIAECANRFYKFAGIENGNECWCGDSLVPPGSKASDSDCNVPCTGSSSETCGGPWRLSVYKYTSPAPFGYTPPSNWVHNGCYIDSWTRTLTNQVTVSGPFSLDSCIATCDAAGYVYAGAENGNECFCSSTFPSTGVKASDGDCLMPCVDNPAQACGGGWRLSVFSKPYTTPATTLGWVSNSWGYTGCYSDSWTRTLPDYSFTASTMDISYCIWECTMNNGYRYAGIENGNECWCSSTIALTGTKAADAECSTTCPGNGGWQETCGGPWRLSVYEFNHWWDGTPTPYDPPTGWSSLGCYTDSSTRTLTGSSFTSNNMTSPSDCISSCQSNGYKFAGIEAGNECYCSNTIASTGVPTNNLECSTPCHRQSGDKGYACGGGWRLNIFQNNNWSDGTTTPTPTTGTPSPTTTGTGNPTNLVNFHPDAGWSSLGCYADTGNATLPDHSFIPAVLVSPGMCISQCSGYKFVGTENGNECRCSNTMASSAVKVPDIECSTYCPNQAAFFQQFTCGGTGKLDIYLNNNWSAA